MTAEEVAGHYRVSRMTVSRWVKAGDLPAVRLGRKVLRFRREDVEALAVPVQPRGEATA